MEPRQEGLIGGIERPSAPSVEQGFQLPEIGPDQTKERGPEQVAEVGAAQAEAPQVVMPALPSPVLPAQPTPAAPASTDDDIPSVAGDDDLIEKEWVDKAKKIIADTKDDPYRREKEISRLQIEYIRRRYGRELGDSGD